MKDLIPGSIESYDPQRLETVRRSSHRSLNAVHDAFDLVGGVPRLALWAESNLESFYTKIWNRTIVAQQQMEHSGEITIRAAIGPGPLDGDFTEAEIVATGSSLSLIHI